MFLYTCKVERGNMAIRIDKIIANAGASAAKTAKESKVCKELSRELQMVPKYLECAKSKTGDLYRFNSKQITEIQNACINYETNLPITSVVKDLLDIGSSGKAHQLTCDEIKGFFNATSGMKEIEQKNVIKFMKTAAEDVPEKLTTEALRKEIPYEDYRRAYMISNQDYVSRKSGEEIEKEIKNFYDTMISADVRLKSNRYYAGQLSPLKQDCLKYLTDNNRAVVETVATSSNPEALYHVFKSAGVNQNTLNSAEDLISLYTMSKGNKFLIKDLSQAFYSDEINEITVLLKQNYNNKKYALEHYYSQMNEFKQVSTRKRKNIIKILEMENDYKPQPLRWKMSEDVYSDAVFGLRGRRVVDGSYESGKKK